MDVTGFDYREVGMILLNVDRIVSHENVVVLRTHVPLPCEPSARC